MKIHVKNMQQFLEGQLSHVFQWSTVFKSVFANHSKSQHIPIWFSYISNIYSKFARPNQFFC